MPASSDFVDLHCHYVPRIDDGVRDIDAARELLVGLRALGFSTVVATPHMRPGMFDNDADGIRHAFVELEARFAGDGDLPQLGLGAEHYFGDVVFERLMNGGGVTYPGGRAALIEFSPEAFPAFTQARLYDLHRKGVEVVVAHPERYAPVWKDIATLAPLIDAGAKLLLDLGSLVGRYGRKSQRAAEAILEECAFDAACTDSHKPSDLDDLPKAIDRLRALVGPSETDRLLSTGPRKILA